MLVPGGGEVVTEMVADGVTHSVRRKGCIIFKILLRNGNAIDQIDCWTNVGVANHLFEGYVSD